MQVPSLLRMSATPIPPLHRWPKSIKRFMLMLATILCFSIYVLLIIGVISLLAIVFDFISRTF